MTKICIFGFFTVYGVLLLPSFAQAYLDPGNGSMLLQLLLGGVAGLSVVVKLYWRRFLTAIGLAKPEEDTSPQEQTQSDASSKQHVNQP